MTHRFTAIAFAALTLLLVAASADAQPLLDQAGQWVTNSRGFQIYDASASVGYSSLGTDGAVASSASYIGSSTSAWASLSAGYTRTGAKYHMSILYSPSYSGMFSVASLNAFNQSGTFSFFSQLNPKWTFYSSATVSDNTVEQFLFARNPLSQLVGSGGTSEQLAGTLLGTDKPIGSSGLQAILFGTRMLTFSVNDGVTYKPSTRLSISLDSGMSRSQALDNKVRPTGVLVENTHLVQGNIRVSFAANTRTDYTVESSVSQVAGLNGNYRLMTLSSSVGRKLGEHWFASGGGGLGYVVADGLVTAVPGGASWVSNLGMGYKGRSHGWAATYDRTVGDISGTGSVSTSSLLGSWNYSPALSRWSLFVFSGQQRLAGGPLGNLTVLQASAGFTRKISRQVSANLSYAYLTDTGIPKGTADSGLRVHAFRLSLSWVPLLRTVQPLTDVAALD